MAETESQKARRLALESIERLQALIAEIDSRETQYPEPKSGRDRFCVQVKFKNNRSKTYTYLFLRTDGGWYGTNGVHYAQWQDVANFLRQDRILWHSAMFALQVSGEPVIASRGEL